MAHNIVSIWRARNDLIFFSMFTSKNDEVMDEIKQICSQLLLAKMKKPPCLFYEWFFDPLECINN